jgi:hypothetical protein
LVDVRTVVFGDAVEDAPPAGSYLLVGMYRLSDGARLPVYTVEGERVEGDAIRLDLDTLAAGDTP